MARFKYFEGDDLSNLPLKMLWITDMHPSHNSMWTSAHLFINVALFNLFLVLAIKGISVSHKNDLFFVAECLQTCILMIHAIVKFSLIHMHKPALLKLLDKKRKFWKISDFNKALHKECLTITSISRKFFHWVNFVVFTTGFFFNLQPITTGDLPTVLYVPDGWFNYIIFISWYLSYVVVIGVPGVNCFFCSLAVSVMLQFKLLSHRFEQIKVSTKNSEAKISNTLKELIEYHNFLIRYCEELNSTFKGIFLLQFFISVASGSVSVFIFMQPGNLSNRMKCAAYFVAIITELSFYSVPLELLSEATNYVGHAISNSYWYEISNIKIRRALVLILIRTQKTLHFSGHGLIYMNLQTFLKICKTMFSFYTYLNSLGQKKS